METNRILDEFDRQTASRRENLKKSLENIEAFFERSNVYAEDFDFKVNIEGDFHSLHPNESDFSRLGWDECNVMEKQIMATKCEEKSFDENLFQGRICIVFSFFNLKRLCKFAEGGGFLKWVVARYFYLINEDTVFFFKYFPKRK